IDLEPQVLWLALYRLRGSSTFPRVPRDLRSDGVLSAATHSGDRSSNGARRSDQRRISLGHRSGSPAHYGRTGDRFCQRLLPYQTINGTPARNFRPRPTELRSRATHTGGGWSGRLLPAREICHAFGPDGGPPL